jgi:hypothetical protein
MSNAFQALRRSNAAVPHRLKNRDYKELYAETDDGSQSDDVGYFEWEKGENS